MAELEHRFKQLEEQVRELRAMLETDREQLDRLTDRVDTVVPDSQGPSGEDIQRAFGGRVFGVVGQRGEYGGWGGGPGALQNLSLRFTVQGERVEVETTTLDPHEEWALARLALRALVPEDGEIAPPPPPFTLTFEERAARLRVCGREHGFKSYACAGRSVAFARVGDLWVTLELPTAFLDSQAIELDDQAEFPKGDEPLDPQGQKRLG